MFRYCETITVKLIMPVYVDDANVSARIGYLETTWCHLIAWPRKNPKAIQELHEIAQKIGIKRKWFQSKSNWSHYDIVAFKRQEAINVGAIPITIKELKEMLRKEIGKDFRKE